MLSQQDIEYIKCLIQECCKPSGSGGSGSGSGITSPSLSGGTSPAPAVPTIQQVTTAGSTTFVYTTFAGGIQAGAGGVFNGPGNWIFNGSIVDCLAGLTVFGSLLSVTGGGYIDCDRLHFAAGQGLQFDVSYSSGTVGAAGAAAALPVLPTGYVTITVNGLQKKIPYYEP